MGDDNNKEKKPKKEGQGSQDGDPFAAQKDPNTLSQALDGDVFDAIERQQKKYKQQGN